MIDEIGENNIEWGGDASMKCSQKNLCSFGNSLSKITNVVCNEYRLAAFFVAILFSLFSLLGICFSVDPFFLATSFFFWLGTLIYFNIVEKRLIDAPLKRAGLSVVFLVIQVPAIGYLYSAHLYDLAMLIMITDIPVIYGYLPHCLWKWIKALR